MIRTLLLASMVCATAASAQERMKPGPGLEELNAACTACHSTDYIRMNSTFLTRDGWKAEVAKMRDAYGGPFDDETANTIVNYLTTAYGVRQKS